MSAEIIVERQRADDQLLVLGPDELFDRRIQIARLMHRPRTNSKYAGTQACF